MKSFQFAYESEVPFLYSLSEIREACQDVPSDRILFCLTWNHKVREKADQADQAIARVFPEAIRYGNEAYGSISEGKLSDSVNVTCTVFEKEDSRTELVWVEEGTDISSLDALWKQCGSRPGLRAVELIPSGSYLNVLHIDNSTPDLDESVLIFGGASVNFENPAQGSEIYAAGHARTENGLAAILYFGSELYLSADYILGWKGFGRSMRVSGCEDKTIRELDGMPAFSVYEKYLNFSRTDQDMMVFPLIVEEDGVEFIRTPQVFRDDLSLQMLTDIQEGAYARIAYGDKNTILTAINEKTDGIVAFAPEVIRAYSCAGRRIFWGDEEISRETAPLQEIAPVSGFYTGGELLRFGRKLRVMNSTLVSVSFREGEAEKKVLPVRAETDKSLVSRLTWFAERIVSEQTEQYAHEKLRGDVTDYLANNEGDPIELLKVFAEPMRQLFKADQLVWSDTKTAEVIASTDAAREHTPVEYCSRCVYDDVRHPVYAQGAAEASGDRWPLGLRPPCECPVRAMLSRVILCDGEPVGSLGLHYLYSDHSFTDLERGTMAEFARILSMAMSRWKTQKENAELLRREEEERRLKEAGLSSTVDSLSANYDLVLYTSREKRQVLRLRASEEFAAIFDAMDPSLSDPDKLDNFFRALVLPEEFEDFLTYTSIERVDRYTAAGKPCTYNFRGKHGDRTEYYRIKISQVTDSPGNFIIGLLNINDDFLLRQKLESDEKQLEYLAVIENFTQDYDSISFVRLEDGPDSDVTELYRVSDMLTRLIPGWASEIKYYVRVDLLEKHFVIPEDRVSFRARIRREVVLTNLEEHGVYHISFRANNGESVQYYQIKFTPVRDQDGRIVSIITGLHNADAETLRELQRNEEISAIVYERTAELRKANAVLNNISDNVLEVMSELVENRSVESGSHIRRIKGFTEILTRRIAMDCPEYGISDDQIRMITHASALHDIGKVAIPDSILLKPERLTPEEFEIMKTHSAKGADIVDRMSQIWDSEYISLARDICLHHHEKWDGKGYPDGLKGDEISIAAQIVSVADIYDALTNKRCYKAAYSCQEAYRMIMDGECGQFSDKIKRCFAACRAEFEAYAANPTEVRSSASDAEPVKLEYKAPAFIRSHSFLADKLPMIAEIAEYVPMGFFMYHEQGDRELILSNSRLAYMFGCSTRDEFIEFTGNSVRGLVHPEDFDVSQKSAYSQLTDGLNAMGHVRFHAVTKSGDIKILDGYGHMLRTADMGNVIFSCVIDSTDLLTQPEDKKVLNRLKVLLTDDDEFSRSVNKELLSLEGAEVTEAANGQEAVDAYNASPAYDLILMDIVMPVMNGIDAIARIRKDHPDDDIPIFAFSADSSEEMREKCGAAGADDFIVKPLDVAGLARKLDKCTKEKYKD